MAKRSADVALFEGGDADGKKSKQEHPEGSWACASCGNVNWPKRTTCNQKTCNMPREAADASLQLQGVGGGGGGGAGGAHPEGSWACMACKNINWPKRTECNKCSMPRAGGGAGSALAQLRQLGGFGLPGLGGFAAPRGPHPDGSWLCPGCNNINWPRRTTCNKKECGQPKPINAQAPPAAPGSYQGVDPFAVAGVAAYGGGAGGYAPSYAAAANPYGGYADPLAGLFAAPAPPPRSGGGNPDGSWPCPKCGNVNWPLRTVCNKKECQTPRPM